MLSKNQEYLKEKSIMNKTEVTKVFEEYVVDETAGAVEGYAGIITGAKVEKSLA